MLSAILTILSSAASAVSTWLGLKKQATDETAGEALQANADNANVLATAAASQATEAAVESETLAAARAEALKGARQP